MKLHIGCFDCPHDGWHNTDITPHIWVSRIPLAAKALSLVGKLDDRRVAQHREGVFRKVHYLNVSKRFPYADESVSAVYSSHLIEHLPERVARFMLQETLRVLKPNGVSRVAAPSLEWALGLYSEEKPEKMLNAIFEHSHDNVKNRHQWMYTAPSLCRLFEEVGFSNVGERSFQEGDLPDLERVDNRPENSIYVEGTKA